MKASAIMRRNPSPRPMRNSSLSKQSEPEMTWVKAIVASTIITSLLIVFLGFVPSIFRYWWAGNSDQIASTIKNLTGIQIKDRYNLVRIHDAISMGFQTVIFVIPVAAAYVLGERRRRRLGLRGTEGVKGYLPGK